MATLTIDRSNLSLSDLVFGTDPSTGYVLAPGLSFGTVTWRKATSDAPNVADREMTDYTRDTASISGGVDLYGTSESNLQTKLGVVIAALTQVDATNGFQKFPVTFTHGAAVYSATVTEPGDVTPGDEDGVFPDDTMDGYFILPVRFVLVRNPIALAGPL